MSVAEAQERISSREFIEWLEYEKIEPGEPRRSDWQTALLCVTFARLNGIKTAKMEDFLLKFEQPNYTKKFSDWREIQKKAREAFSQVGIHFKEDGDQ